MLIIPSSLARQGFEDYISGKLSLFFFLPHRNEKSLEIIDRAVEMNKQAIEQLKDQI
ncbi:hypothetical protein [Microcystis aeruginosa]|uniref:Uncharacterized protein n=1 Tax=Microcystis aeruginosa FD4 TaxID=2686288 RepID=A0A857D184_MICAE|nr:hypothetical protein [Microcystis aeruginosa]QGZ89427.1 hypothetical protein GQR42_07445 [Microcystis aeruginosa FD4]